MPRAPTASADVGRSRARRDPPTRDAPAGPAAGWTGRGGREAAPRTTPASRGWRLHRARQPRRRRPPRPATTGVALNARRWWSGLGREMSRGLRSGQRAAPRLAGRPARPARSLSEVRRGVKAAAPLPGPTACSARSPRHPSCRKARSWPGSTPARAHVRPLRHACPCERLPDPRWSVRPASRPAGVCHGAVRATVAPDRHPRHAVVGAADVHAAGDEIGVAVAVEVVGGQGDEVGRRARDAAHRELHAARCSRATRGCGPTRRPTGCRR